MRLLTFRSLWTNRFDLDGALGDCQNGPFDGVEGSLPVERNAQREFVDRLRASDVPFVAEVTTGGGYVPETRDPARHLDDFTRKLEAAMEAAPLFITCLGGCDCWDLSDAVHFFGRALDVAMRLEVTVSFETHRSRATYSPWLTRRLLDEIPTLLLTCDFSHWCCVCERLVMDEEPALLAQISARTNHIHTRVGYEQGPQVPHPAAPEYTPALVAHERWWDAIWQAQANAGRAFTTMTPEFGPDGYLQSLPFTGVPVASLDEINHWMAARQRERFAARQFVAAA